MSNPTDTNQASELYELCKDVYERTGWEGVETYVVQNDDDDEPFLVNNDNTNLGHNIYRVAYLYTSDYLLEKLPKTLKHHEHYDYLTLWSDSETDWSAAYELNTDCENFDTAGDTPLKALLKLTIALSEAGELK